jgi:beta-lactamase regulating signal transducer with metallopeptidase domain
METTTILILLAWVVGPFLTAFAIIRLHRMLTRRDSKDEDSEKREQRPK